MKSPRVKNKLGAWLLANMPPPPPTLLHSDFYLHNIMLAAGDPAGVTGVFDWEMSTMGDPMADLGIALGYWRDRDDSPELLELSQGRAHTVLPGFLSRRQLAERYARQTGRDLSWFDFYWA